MNERAVTLTLLEDINHLTKAIISQNNYGQDEAEAVVALTDAKAVLYRSLRTNPSSDTVNAVYQFFRRARRRRGSP